MPVQNSIVIKQFVPKGMAQAQDKPKRVRPKVPEEQRKRVRLACESCRTRKEKCDGQKPCQRCSREAVVCVPGTASSYSRMNQSERVERLQVVVRHTLGINSLTDEELRVISDSISKKESELGDHSDSHLGNSLSTFSRELERKLGDVNKGNEAEYDGEPAEDDGKEDVMAHFCRSPSTVSSRAKSFTQSTLAVQPSKQVADRLARVFFEKVQCNSFHVEERWVRAHLDLLYQRDSAPEKLDIPVVATLSLIMALGSQFCSDPALEPLGLSLYEHATTIVPELVKRSDFESIRACVLLATYLFPVDHSGSAYSYLGLALHMAMSRKMHQSYRNEIELRVWWTLYTFYQRARIFHGHPKTLTCADVTVRRPHYEADLEPMDGVSNFDNQVALIEITIVLEKIAEEISSLRKQRAAVHMANLLALRRKLVSVQSQLPSLESATNTARLRLDIHLYLFYWHARLYLGRPFILEPSSTDAAASAAAENAPAGLLFAQDAFEAAMQIMQLCQKIQLQLGLSQASYVTEFTSCRAAMLVLIAKGLTDKSPELSETLTQGLKLIQYLSHGQSKASSETRVITALQRAIARLHKRQTPTNDTLTDRVANAYTKEWEVLWQQQSPGYAQTTEVGHDAANLPRDMQYEADMAFDYSEYSGFDSENVNFNTQLEEFSLFPLDDMEGGAGFDTTGQHRFVTALDIP